MTNDRLALQDLIDKSSDRDLLREMIAFVTSRMMDVEVETLTGATHNSRSAERVNSRNGYRTRPWHTTVGTVPVAIPKLRKGSYFPSFLEARQTSEKALIAVIQEAYVHGVSTRSVTDLAEAMGMSVFRKAMCRDCAETSTDASNNFSNGRSKAPGPTCGSMPPTSRFEKAAGSFPLL